MNNAYHTLSIKEPYNYLLHSAINTALYLFVDLTTPLSKSVFNSLVFSLDEIENLKLRINLAKTEIDLTEREMELIYICHCIAASFANHKESFFKWLLTYDNNGNAITDSEDFRKVMFEGQKTMINIIEESELNTNQMKQIKLKLIQSIGAW